MAGLKDKIGPGVITSELVQEVYDYAKAHQFALTGANVTGTNTINAVLETAKEINSPVIIQLSNGGASFFAGNLIGGLILGVGMALTGY